MNIVFNYISYLAMNKLEFACIIEMIQLNFDHKISDSNLIALIYDEYVKTFYEKYTLLKLISMLDKRGIYIGCSLNKQKIIKYVKDHDLDLPDKDRYDKPSSSVWTIYNMRYIHHLTPTYSAFINKNIICIQNTETRTEIMPDDVYKIQGIRYRVGDISENSIQLFCPSRPY